MTIVEMCVHMDCPGCETKIRKALKRVKGVHEVEVDMPRQKVTVTGWADQKKLLKAVRRTGRRAVFWPDYGTPGDAAYLHYSTHTTLPAQTAVAGYHAHPALVGPAPASSYNYYVHGYSGAYDYRRQETHGGGGYKGAAGEGAMRSLFSDENPHACSIM